MAPTPPQDPQGVQTVVTTQTIVDPETPEQKYARLYSQPMQQQAPPPPQQVAPVPQAPQVVSLPPEVTETLAAMRNEMQELRNTVKPPAPATPAGEPQGWVDKIRQGDFAGAEQALIAQVRRGIEDDVNTKAFQATQVQLAIDRHVQEVKLANPDIARFERYLTAPVNARVEAARAAGRIRSSEDLVREWNSAVDAEVLELRNIGLQYRADGKQEATTRTTSVQVGAFTPAPQQVGDHVNSPAPQSQQGESTDDYFARRQQSAARLRNLT